MRWAEMATLKAFHACWMRVSIPLPLKSECLSSLSVLRRSWLALQNGRTALHWASINGHIHEARLLVERVPHLLETRNRVSWYPRLCILADSLAGWIYSIALRCPARTCVRSRGAM